MAELAEVLVHVDDVGGGLLRVAAKPADVK